jgi:hypothetical protein
MRCRCGEPLRGAVYLLTGAGEPRAPCATGCQSTIAPLAGKAASHRVRLEPRAPAGSRVAADLCGRAVCAASCQSAATLVLLFPSP